MTVPTTDPGEVRVVGENPVMYLYGEPGSAPTSSVNLWRVWFSPAGPGNVLFLHGELTGGEPRVYADNPGLSRFLREEIVRAGQPYKDAGLPVTTASFSPTWLLPWHLTVSVTTPAEEIVVCWHDFEAPFAGRTAPEVASGGAYGHYAVYLPARRAEASLDGRNASGIVQPLLRDGRDIHSAFVALAESWQRYD